MEAKDSERLATVFNSLFLFAAGVVTYAWAPSLAWNWFVLPRTGYHLGPGQALALAALCRIFAGGRSHPIGQSTEIAQKQEYASLLHVWTMVAGCWILYALGVEL